MAKTITTRIQNKFDSYANWENTSGLLKGEIALVQVTNTQKDDNGNIIEVPALLMKVGNTDAQGNSIAFKDLPWLSAKAADVYEWAKKPTAEEIPFTMTDGTAATSNKNLRQLLEAINNKAIKNASDLGGVDQRLGVVEGKVDVTKVSTAITTAINALTHSDNTNTAGDNVIVKAVTQANGQVSVTYGKITNEELPNDIAASKVIVTGTQTLTAKLGLIDADLDTLKARNNGHTDAQINTLIDNKINALDVNEPTASGTSTSFIATAKQENGKIVVTKANLPEAVKGQTTKGIVALGVTGGAADHDAVFGTNGLESKVTKNASDIQEIKDTIARGVNFRGEVETAPTGTTYTLKGEATAKTALVGDIVICDEKEYIYVASGSWKELGDLSRVGTLESWRNKLVSNDTAVASQFVTEVDIATDGTVTISRARPTAADISYGTNSDVNTKLGLIDSALEGKSNTTHTHSEYVNQNAFSSIKVGNTTVVADTATDTVEFVGENVTITPDATNDKVTFKVEEGDTSKKGIVQLSNATNSDSEALAATPKAVKAAMTAASSAQNTADGAVDRVEDVEGDYVRFNGNKLYIGKDGTEEIIFDCGGAI